MRIYLTGFMGSGKTEVGRRLSARLGLPFVDLDREIAAAAGCSIPEIFDREGEEGFRRRERAALAATASYPRAVVATGGGLVTSEENRRWLATHGCTVWLNPPFTALVRRLGPEARAGRPLFQDEGQAEALWRRRLPDYRRCDVEIPVTATETPEETAEKVTRTLAERSCAT